MANPNSPQIQVTITKPGKYDLFGLPLIVGNSYIFDYYFARSLYMQGFATLNPNQLDVDVSELATIIPGYSQFSCAIPSILAPNGTIATTGVVTLGTALPTTNANAWCYFPAGAVVAGSAGMYFVKFSSTTVGQVYTNYVDASTTAHTPYIPSTQVAAVGSNSAYTQTTAANLTLANITIAGGSMGLNGSIRQMVEWVNNNSVGAKIEGHQLGGSSYLALSRTTSTGDSTIHRITNRGVSNSQKFGINFSGSAPSNGTGGYLTVDTSINQALTLTGQIATATDYIILEAFTVEILPA